MMYSSTCCFPVKYIFFLNQFYHKLQMKCWADLTTEQELQVPQKLGNGVQMRNRYPLQFSLQLPLVFLGWLDNS